MTFLEVEQELEVFRLMDQRWPQGEQTVMVTQTAVVAAKATERRVEPGGGEGEGDRAESR